MTIKFSNNEELITLSENIYGGTIRLHGSDKLLSMLTEFHKEQLHNHTFNPEEDIRGFKKTFDGFSFEASVKSNPVETGLLGYCGNNGLLEKCFDNYLGYKDNVIPVEAYNNGVDAFYQGEESSRITLTRIDDPKNGLTYKVYEHSYGNQGQVSSDICYKGKERHGYSREFDLQGLLQSNELCKNGKRHGACVTFFPLTDTLVERREYQYSDGKKVGEGKFSQYFESVNPLTKKVERKLSELDTERINFSRVSKKKNPYLTLNNKEKKGRSL